MYYASFGMLSIVIHLIINFEAIWRVSKDENSIVRKRYKAFVLGLLFYYCSDVLWGLFYASKIVPLAYGDTVLFFFSMGLTLFLWMRFIVVYLNRKDFFSRILTYFGWCMLFLESIVLLVNAFIPIMFAFGSDGEYYPGSARYITLGTQFLMFLAMAFYPLIVMGKTSKHERLHLSAIGISGFAMAVFIVLQLLYPLLPFYAIGCLIANCIIHTYVEVDQKAHHENELGSVRNIAYKDPLTNVRNSNAYTEAKGLMEERIQNNDLKELGIVVFDLNNLKKVNDSFGHDMGDKYIQASCKMICRVYQHSPVFRIGGDEFVAFLEGEDFKNRDSLIKSFDEEVEKNLRSGGPVVAAGMGIFDPEKDFRFDDVFSRADARMYEQKKLLKGYV